MTTTITKTNHTAMTKDQWRLHLVRTRSAAGATAGTPDGRLLPIILIPGLCSSGTFCFDLSPVVSLADWLAEQGWDVWTAELRGNGLSDKPGLFSARSHHWTIDDLVDMDIPAVMTYVCMESGCTAAHCIGHSMGGMILTAAMSRLDATSARMRSVTIIGSSCFLEGSWWAVLEPTLPAVRLLHSVPAGTTLRLYSQLAFTRLGIRAVDVLYFWPTNTDPALARALLARNFSATSPGVILQLRSAFHTSGLCACNGGMPFADPARLAAVTTPVMFLIGDKDKMCPPQGASKQYDMLVGSSDRRLVILGPAPKGRAGLTPKAVANPKGQPNTFTQQHYGHFDILMGKRVVVEVFPKLHAWLVQHDTLEQTDTPKPTHSLSTPSPPASTASLTAAHALQPSIAPYNPSSQNSSPSMVQVGAALMAQPASATAATSGVESGLRTAHSAATSPRMAPAKADSSKAETRDGEGKQEAALLVTQHCSQAHAANHVGGLMLQSCAQAFGIRERGADDGIAGASQQAANCGMQAAHVARLASFVPAWETHHGSDADIFRNGWTREVWTHDGVVDDDGPFAARSRL